LKTVINQLHGVWLCVLSHKWVMCPCMV